MSNSPTAPISETQSQTALSPSRDPHRPVRAGHPRVTESPWTTPTPTGHTHDELPTHSPEKPWAIQEARRPRYIGFTHRVPFVVDAYQIGYAPGRSEEYDYQDGAFDNVNVPVVFLDNDFRHPDVDRWLEEFEQHEPKVGVLGDAFTREEAREYVKVTTQIRAEYPTAEPIIVPKCDCFDLIPGDIILGYAEGAKNGDGKAALHPHDFSDDTDWRGRRVHILGGTPTRQYQAIDRLTAPNLQGHSPADIIGLDYNGYVHMTQHTGKYWTRDGWQNPQEERGTRYCRDHWANEGYIHSDPERGPHEYSVREKTIIGLHEAKRYFMAKGLWPAVTPREVYGPAVLEPDHPALVDDTPISYTTTELESGVARLHDDLPGDPGRDRIAPTLADEDQTNGGTPHEGPPGRRQPIRIVEYADGSRLAYRNHADQRRHEATTDILETHGAVTRTYEHQSTRTCLTPNPNDG